MHPIRFVLPAWRTALAAGLLSLTGVMQAAVGDLDTAFSSDGVDKSLVGGYQGEWRQVLPLSGGSIVVAGTAYYHPELRFSVPVSGLVARYTSAGALDTTFGSNGYYLRSGAGSQASTYNDIVRLASGKYLVTGVLDTPAKKIFVTRLNENGSLDTTFGTSGHATAAPDNLLSPRIVARADGSFLIAAPRVGTGTGSGTVHVMAFTATGASDSAFDSDGARELAFAGTEFTEQTSVGLVLQGDGKVLVGATEYGGGGDIVVYRLNTNGSNDTSFDNALINQDGKAIYSPGNSQEELHDIALQADGRIVIVGAYRPTTTVPFQGIIIRANANGGWDSTFDADGYSTADIPGYDGEVFHRAMVQSDGDILVLGNALVGASYPQESRLLTVRFNTNGSLDNAFGSNGAVVYGPSTIGKCSYGFAAAVGGIGNVYFAGESTGSIWQNSACNAAGDFLLGRQLGAPLGTPSDTTPDTFAFVDRTGVGRSTVVFSAPVTITGIDAPAQIDVTGGQYSIGCTGSATDATGTISAGQTLCARLITSANYSTATSMVVTIGGVSDTFSATTVDAPAAGTDTTPNAFTLMDLTDMPSGVQVTSAAISVSGIDAAAPVSVVGGEYSVGCTATFTSAAGTVNNAQTVCVRHVTAAACAATRDTVLTIGGVSDTFTTTTYDDTGDTDGDGVTDCSDSAPTDATAAAVRTAAGQSLAISTSAGTLADVEWQPATAASNGTGLASNRMLAYGMVGYRVVGLANGASAVVTLAFPAFASGATLLKYTAADGFTDITADSHVAITGGTVTLTLVDGGFGDADGTANGVIVDPVAVAVARPASSGGGGGCALRSGAPGAVDPSLPALGLLAALYLWRRRATA